MQNDIRHPGQGFRTWGVGFLVLITALVGFATASVAADGQAPPPQDLRLVLDDGGEVERLDWDAPDGVNPSVYEVNYRFASEAPSTSQVFWWTFNTHLTAAESFGSFVVCEDGHHPSDEWIVWITYPTPNGPSEASNQVSMCFP